MKGMSPAHQISRPPPKRSLPHVKNLPIIHLYFYVCLNVYLCMDVSMCVSICVLMCVYECIY